MSSRPHKHIVSPPIRDQPPYRSGGWKYSFGKALCRGSNAQSRALHKPTRSYTFLASYWARPSRGVMDILATPRARSSPVALRWVDISLSDGSLPRRRQNIPCLPRARSLIQSSRSAMRTSVLTSWLSYCYQFIQGVYYGVNKAGNLRGVPVVARVPTGSLLRAARVQRATGPSLANLSRLSVSVLGWPRVQHTNHAILATMHTPCLHSALTPSSPSPPPPVDVGLCLGFILRLEACIQQRRATTQWPPCWCPFGTDKCDPAQLGCSSTAAISPALRFGSAVQRRLAGSQCPLCCRHFLCAEWPRPALRACFSNKSARVHLRGSATSVHTMEAFKNRERETVDGNPYSG